MHRLSWPILRTSLATHRLGPIAWALAGALVLALVRWLDGPVYLAIAGLLMLAIGSGFSVVSRAGKDQYRACQ